MSDGSESPGGGGTTDRGKGARPSRGGLGVPKTVGLLALLVVGLWVAVHSQERRRRRPVPTDATEAVPAETPEQEVARLVRELTGDAGEPDLPAAPPLPTLGAAVPPPPPKPSASVAPPRPVLPPAADSDAELRFLQRAQEALIDSPQMALALADEDVRRYPYGILRPEAEVIAIEALARTGRREAALARAEKFRAANPRSTHLRRIDAILEPQPPAPQP